MQTIRCRVHNDEFTLPVEDYEYFSGKYHDDVKLLCKHVEIHNNCEFEEFRK
mgnify:CR=1 FL=1